MGPRRRSPTEELRVQISDLKFLMLLQDGPHTLLKVSTVYERMFTAQVELVDGAPPPRTQVREYTQADLDRMKPPSQQLLNRYDDAYGRV